MEVRRPYERAGVRMVDKAVGGQDGGRALDGRAVLARRREIAWRTFEGEAILVVTARDEICHLNPVATFLWESLDGRSSLVELANKLCETFEVGREEALADALEFASDLLQRGMVEVVEDA